MYLKSCSEVVSYIFEKANLIIVINITIDCKPFFLSLYINNKSKNYVSIYMLKVLEFYFKFKSK